MISVQAKAGVGADPEAAIPLREKCAYGFGNFASVLYWQTFMVYLAFFYTDVFGLTAAATGLMLGLSRSLDAFVDPLMGMLADRTASRWGKFRPYLLWLGVPLALAGVATFTVPAFSPAGKLLWAIVTYNVLMLLYTGINVPYAALMGVMSPNPAERMRLSSIMLIGAFTAGNVISWTLLPLVNGLGRGRAADGWRDAFILIGAVAVGSFLVTFAHSRERVVAPQAQPTSVRRDLGDLLTNGPWLILLAATVTFVLFGAVRASVSAHYFKYFVGPQRVSLPSFLPWIGGEHVRSFASLVSAFNGVGQAASLAGVLLMPLLVRWLGSKAVLVSSFGVGIAGTAASYFPAPDQVGLIFLLNVIVAFCSGLAFVLLWPMCADTADYAEWKTGRRATGLVLSASILAQKQGWAIGAWLALGLLGHFGFRANQIQSPRTLHGLVLLMSLIPAALGALSLVIVLFYPLTESRLRQITADLKSRRTRADPAGGR